MDNFTLLSVIVATGLGVSVFVVWFNRDPERYPPKSDRLIVSPADGRIIYVKSFGCNELPTSAKFGRRVRLEEIDSRSLFPHGGYLLGIRLSPFDVHVTRSPISGVVQMIRYTKGRPPSIRPPRLGEAERNTLVIHNGGLTIGVVQMAAYLVRRVVVQVGEGALVTVGQKIGGIRLGSQVDLLIPKTGLSLCVSLGMRVRAGESIVANLSS